MKLHMLTTVDNPWNPHTHYQEWAAFDERAGYNTPQLLARTCYSSHELSDEDQNLAIEEAIDLIVSINASGMHMKVEVPAEEEVVSVDAG